MRLVSLLGLTVLFGCPSGDGGKDSPVDSKDSVPVATDQDGDGYPDEEDCAPTDATIHPGAPETCDGVDQNCDDAVDEGLSSSWFKDEDGDGVGAGSTLEACAQPSGYTDQDGDCNDADPRYYPGAPESDCTDPNDYNCDGSVGFSDADADGVAACQDCDDANPAVKLGATELCNQVDDNCDGTVDEDSAADASTWYTDGDADGYGLAGTETKACTAPAGTAAVEGDCNDADAAYNPGASETDCADPNDYNCDGSVGFTDGDGDGFPACQDCNDAEGAVNSAAAEACNGIDDNCDGTIDEVGATGGSTWYADQDGDGYGDPLTTQTACAQPTGFVADDADCEDGDAAVSPAGVESCNGLDDNCDGTVDEDSAVDGVLWYIDADGDGYGDDGMSLFACTAPSGTVAIGGDCDDADTAYNPGAVEADCTDPNDYNCDGSAGSADADGDGYVACIECDDNNAAVNPAASESCNGVDDNCDGAVDEATAVDAVTWYADGDEDGYGDPSMSVQACDAPVGYIADWSDCDDLSAAVSPGATETCNLLDDNCDGVIDESTASGAGLWYTDGDGDGYGVDGTAVSACTQPSGTAALGGDCNDGDTAYNPGASETVCTDPNDYNCDGSSGYRDNDGDGFAACVDCDDSNGAAYPGAVEYCNGQDDNCDGQVDEVGAVNPSTWYLDGDGDGYGSSSSTLSACSAPSGYVGNSTDCNDGAASINPGATEVCDSGNVDEDCDGLADDSDNSVSTTTKSTGYQDADGDTYGSASAALTRCDLPSSYVRNSTDCNDNNAAISPAATEVCDSSNVDEDCDGLTDDADSSVSAATKSTWYRDSDNDTYGNLSVTIARCDLPSGYVSNSTDCNDLVAAVNPGATEICDSSNVDEDCDGLTDDADSSVNTATRSLWFRDADSDTYGSSASTISRCDLPSGYVADSTDCNDSSAVINPAATEICDSGSVDEDCDGLSDDADSSVRSTTRSTWYRDADSDTYGTSSTTLTRCDQPTGYVSNGTDCDDSLSTINPGRSEVCDAANTDEDCDGLTDNSDPSATGRSLFYADIDGDGYASTTNSSSLCDATSTYSYATVGTDCNDAVAAIRPGATESCNGVDDNCNGTIDEGTGAASTWYRDADGDTYGSASTFTSACSAPVGYVSNSTDCNDSVAAINPAATEICDAANTDEDCDGTTDDNDSSVGAATKSTWYRDVDSDTYGTSATTLSRCDLPSGYVAATAVFDCNDSVAAINPAATEVCDINNTDEDCDGSADDNDSSVSAATLSTWYRDADSDTYGALATTLSRCDLPSGYVSNSTDCNDSLAAINPGATEVCDAADTDEDCDNLADNADSSATGRSTFYATVDADADSYAANNNASSSLCDATSTYPSTTQGTDCNDAVSSTNPGATEYCNGADDDCDGFTDESTAADALTWYLDADVDGYGTAGTSTIACTQPSGYTALGTDCNDGVYAINPGATEVCDAANTDEDCDGLADNNDSSATGTSTYYYDGDGDGYGTTTSSSLCDASGYYTATVSTDCNDAAASVNPGATETCNSVDDNCDGSIDNGALQTYYRDVDGDGFGTTTTTTTAACASAPVGYRLDSTDCNDATVLVHPYAYDLTGDGTDSDCNGSDVARGVMYNGPVGDDAATLISTATTSARFPFCGTSYSSFYMQSNGRVTLGASDTDYSETLAELAGATGDIAIMPYWDDLSSSTYGTTRIEVFSDALGFYWNGVPEIGGTSTTGNTFAAVLFIDGTVLLTYGTLGGTGKDGIMGWACGGTGTTTPTEINLSAISYPVGYWGYGTGSERAIVEQFTGGTTDPIDLANTALRFCGNVGGGLTHCAE